MRSPGSRAIAALAAVVALALALAAPAVATDPEWNVARIGGPASAPGVLVAVVDTGVDGSHPALAGRVERAIDLVGGSGGDPNGHGTHVAGTVAGADAGCGAIGVTPDARILPVRVLDESGEGTVAVVAEGIRRAADAGAAVVNLSLGADVVLRNLSGSDLAEALAYAWAKGSIPVLAAGNEGLLGGIFGSGYGDLPAVVVIATDHRDRVAPYASSIGSAEWGVAAPGGDTSGEEGRDIRSAFPGRRCALNAGTSMAAPHASAALAALRAAGLDPRAAVERLLATARDLGSPGPDRIYGHGLVDLRAALGAPPARPATPPSMSAPPEPTPTTAAATTARRPPPEEDLGPTASPDPADPPVPGPAEADDGAEADPPAPQQGEAVDDGTRSDEDGSSIAADDPADEDEDGGTPAGVVLVAVGTLGIAGAASGVAARRLGRRVGRP